MANCYKNGGILCAYLQLRHSSKQSDVAILIVPSGEAANFFVICHLSSKSMRRFGFRNDKRKIRLDPDRVR
jgi:hypothetical protein